MEARSSSIPNAMLLFNPALVLANIEGEQPIPQEKQDEFLERVGEDPKNISPAHHVKPGAPPTIIFTARQTQPFHTEPQKFLPKRCTKLAIDASWSASTIKHMDFSMSVAMTTRAMLSVLLLEIDFLFRLAI